MLNMKFHYILTILNNYFDQFYWHSISKEFVQLQYAEFKVTVQYANEVLALELLEIVLIGWHSAQFRMLQDFTSWCEECTRASWHIVLDMIILSYISFIVSFCILLRWSSIWYMILILEIWLHIGIKIHIILKYYGVLNL